MSSCAGGVVVIAGGVAALSVGAATAAVFGTSWMLYQGGSLVVHTVQGINRAVEEKEQKRLLQEKLRYDAALRNQQHIRNLQTSFLTEVREDLQSFSLKSGTAETVSGLQKLAAEAEALSFGNSDLTVQMEAANIAGLAALEKLAHKKEALLQKESSPVSTMGEHVLIEY
ncbi:MAG TPA: hypothetical protein DCZ91_01630, partial [Lachnospiraceae bacterium]|nr:hypothetical protein [Lachnospiraceae bacterium]